MRILLDTNVLTRSAQRKHVQHAAAVGAVAQLRRRGDLLFIVPQNLYEFWVVATRPPGENGLGRTPKETAKRLIQLRRSYSFLPDHRELFQAWERLVAEHDVSGKAAHDARLVAAMMLGRLDAVLTFNGSHFARYTEIQILSPDKICAT